jgi:hypothetical protein
METIAATHKQLVVSSVRAAPSLDARDDKPLVVS